jgi:SAM-dependent methyltransferase
MSRDSEQGVPDWRGARGEKWRAGLVGMEATLEPIDEPLIRSLALDAPRRIVDVGCGGGGTTLAILRRAPAGSVVHGIDISPALIEVARGRIRHDAIAFDVADIASAPAPDLPYDRLVSRFSVMFFDEPQAAFSNLARWLAPDGRFAMAVWGAPADNPWITIVRDVVAGVVDVPSIAPDAPGLFRYADAGKLCALLERAGFGDVEVRDWRGALPMGGAVPAAKAATFALASMASFAELLEAAGEEARRRAHESLTARLRGHERGGAVWMDACVHLVTGARA